MEPSSAVDRPSDMMSASGAMPCTASTSSVFSTMTEKASAGVTAGEPSGVGTTLSWPGRSVRVPTRVDQVFTSCSRVSMAGVTTATVCPAPVAVRSGEPAEVAAVIAFLADPDAVYLNGVHIPALPSSQLTV
jgi:NAD(P)-dependent dehydrogenase (short-subunit alcohol dehydrogenase family)